MFLQRETSKKLRSNRLSPLKKQAEKKRSYLHRVHGAPGAAVEEFGKGIAVRPAPRQGAQLVAPVARRLLLPRHFLVAHVEQRGVVEGIRRI